MDTLKELVAHLYEKKADKAYAALCKLEELSLTSNEGYAYMDSFLLLLSESNSYLRTRGIRLCAAYAVWDHENRLDSAIDAYLACLQDASAICARKCIQYLPLIMKAKPSLRPIVQQALQKVDLAIYDVTMQPLLRQDIQKAVESIFPERSITMNEIDHYIAQCPKEYQEKLYEIREIIKEAAPEASEKISWSMPTFYLKGNLVHFALHKTHIGFYPGASGVEHFLTKLKEYKHSKGAIQFPIHQPLPKALIQEIVLFRKKENMQD